MHKVKVREAKIRNPYDQIPHITQDTIWQSDKTQENITYKSAKRSALSQQVTTRLQHVNIHLTTDKHNSLFLMNVALLSISPAGRGQLVKMLMTLEPHGIFGLNRNFFI